MDVAVIGGGITGLISALQLVRAGKRVVVIDQGELVSGESAKTTAQLTEFIDTPYREIRENFGDLNAKRVAEATRHSIQFIERIAKQLQDEYGVDSEFELLPAYLYGENEQQLDELRTELSAAWDSDVAAYWTDEIPLLGPAFGGIEMERQAILHPRKFLLGLVEMLEEEGCLFFENTRAHSIEDGTPCKVVTDFGVIRADDVVIATHAPAEGMFLQTKVAAYRTYVLALRFNEPFRRALYFDRQDPYHYLRPHRDLWLLGGEDHKTGTDEDAEAHFARLEEYAARNFGVEKIEGRWSGQILEPADGLPYIGASSGSKHLFVATGFSGNGITFGTVAGILLADLIRGEANAWEEVFRATRMKPLSSLACYVSENADFPKYFLKDRLQDSEVDSVDDIECGEGKRVRSHGKILAVYRDENTRLHAVSAVCPHAGCYVHWNSAEATWDCPCHGSRFSTEGRLLNGPALEDLPRESLAREDPPIAPLEPIGPGAALAGPPILL